MNDKNSSKKNSEIDFVNKPSFQKQISKTRRKQIGLYIIISLVSLVVTISIVHSGSRYLIHKKIDESKQQDIQVFSDKPVKGAGIKYGYTTYHYNLFSVEAETTYFKTIGNRKIIWDTETKKYPAIGGEEVIDRGTGIVEDNPMDQYLGRPVIYNYLTNERVIEFYYPGIDYEFLPQELDIATELDENKLIEIAISFNEPILINELGKKLGSRNVDWLWIPSKTKAQEEIHEVNKVRNGNSAYGFGVSSENPYWENFEKNLSASGAVISGTPQELERFLNMNFIRSSTIGVTIDKY
ncbi:hypothetical protein GCM10011351_31040 [Paraliobacillus quinghaiensis]|uniref:Sigma factor regulator C-terminal domain-containing protein n=1 Tax=Paraliobacillus quinghaiensis TaxID=470815 RepID=A0A917TX91_9BACI|nr:anti sigma factor C-terminal domain-containing protein [Paraliobacillus quinghaiensis]GGM42908.1 hypothetical protein GCM10011351_31040 [Paraliobacillus quinghaiensis]